MEIKITLHKYNGQSPNIHGLVETGSIYLEDRDITPTLRKQIQQDLEKSLNIDKEGAHIGKMRE